MEMDYKGVQVVSLIFRLCDYLKITKKQCYYTGVVNPKPTIGKPRNGQRNVHYCMRGTKTDNEKNIK